MRKDEPSANVRRCGEEAFFDRSYTTYKSCMTYHRGEN